MTRLISFPLFPRDNFIVLGAGAVIATAGNKHDRGDGPHGKILEYIHMFS
ncbi:hypothetical protein [Fibrobacter sp. UWH9]|nr:hypothetical protein [Fibrobacter sp. UWH9]